MFYKKSLLNAIGSTIGEVVKVDDNTKNGMRGLPTHMEAIVDLSKPLILRVCIENALQRVEYRGLPTIYFCWSF